MSTATVVERIVPINLVYATVFNGVADRTEASHAAVIRLLEQAMADEAQGMPRPKRESAARYARKAADAVLRPFVESNESCAKFGLIVFYALRILIDEGAYELRNGAFAEAMDAVLNPEGTVTEMANISGVDRSAQKHARKLVKTLRDMGYFQRSAA